MGLKFRRGSTAQQSGSLAFGEPYVNTTLGTLVVGGATGDIVLSSAGTGSTGNFGAISGSGLDITGNANIAGNLTLGGQLTIGDQTSDTVNVVASLSSSLIPQTTNVFDLGSATKIWRDLYISTGSIKFVEGTTVVKEFTLTTLTSLESATGSSNVSITNLNTTTASLNTSVSNLNTFSGSQLGKDATLATLTASYDGRFTTLATYTGSNDTTNTTQNSRLDQLSTASGSAITRLTALEVETANLETFTSSINTTIKNGLDVNTVVSGSSQITYANISSIPSGIISGSSQLSGTTITNLTITNLTTVNQTASVLFSSGSNKFGDFSNDTHEFTGSVQISGSITTIGTATATSFNGTINATNGVVSGSSQVIDILSSLNTYTGSNDTTNTTQNSRLDQLSTASGSAITRLSTLEVETANLETFSGSANTRFTEIGVVSGSLITSASAAKTTNDSHGVSITNLNSATASLNTSVSNLNTTTASLLIETSNLETFTASLSTTSNVRFNSLGIGMAATGTAGRIDASGDIVAFSTSDKNFKENITPIESPIEKIRMISGNTYDWKADMKEFHGFEGNDVGVIAQEIEAVLPQLVTTRETGYKAVKYDKLVALLIEGIKEQQTQIEKLRIDLDNYECKCDNCKSK